MMYAVIAVHLGQLMQKQGVSMYRLVKDTGLTTAALRNLRDGKSRSISFDVMERLCVFFHCDITDLISLAPEQKNKV